MIRRSFEFFTAMALTLGAILALSLQARAGDIEIAGAFARASAMPTQSSGAVYLTLKNASDQPDTLLGISTDAAMHAMLHETKIANGVAKMSMMDQISIPAGGMLELSPSGSHIMLEGLKAPLKQGEKLTLNLKFQNAGDVNVDVTVGSVAAMSP
jgi:periplasmic copper chaperone A